MFRSDKIRVQTGGARRLTSRAASERSKANLGSSSLQHLRSDVEYLEMDGKWWLEVEADLARDIRETVHKRGRQLQAAAGKVIADTVLEGHGRVNCEVQLRLAISLRW